MKTSLKVFLWGGTVFYLQKDLDTARDQVHDPNSEPKTATFWKEARKPIKKQFFIEIIKNPQMGQEIK
jgi:hypothetical protein